MLKQEALQALRIFIENASNENKMELHIAYEEIPDEEKEKVLGSKLNQALARIIHENDHPDAYLEELQTQFFT